MVRRIILICCLALFAGESAPAGLFGEHKAMGDTAFARFLRTHRLLRFFNDTLGMDVGLREGVHNLFSSRIGGTNFGVTYGDLCGLSGDHESNPLALLDDLASRATTLSRSLKANLEGIVENRKGASDVKLTAIDLFYPIRAIIDKSHFYRLGESLADQLSRVDVRHLIELRGDFAALEKEEFADLLESNAVAKFAILHSLALDVMFLAGTLYRETDPYSLHQSIQAFELGLMLNAFGDHFLQDAFAAGHLAVLRSGWKALDNKGTHDYYNRNGLEVANRRGERWKEYGDGFIETGSEGFAEAVEANLASLNELWAEFLGGQKEGGSFLNRMQSATNVPEFLLENVKAFERVPLPVNPEEIHFANSRNGTYLALSGGRAFSGAFDGGKGDFLAGQAGLGLCLEKAPQNDLNRESLLWVSVNLSYFGGRGWHLWKGGGEVILGDWFSAGAQLGGLSVDGRSRFCLTASTGAEFKPVTWSVAPSLRFEGSVVAGRSPLFSVRCEIRYY